MFYALSPKNGLFPSISDLRDSFSVFRLRNKIEVKFAFYNIKPIKLSIERKSIPSDTFFFLILCNLSF